jgi:hypothetical protein
MRGGPARGAALALLGLTLTACAARQPVTGYYATPSMVEAAQERPAAVVLLNLLTSPVYFAVKAVACAASAMIAIPATAVTAITDPYGLGWQRQSIADGIATNCSPPYVVP